jgi:hypothetical protein
MIIPLPIHHYYHHIQLSFGSTRQSANSYIACTCSPHICNMLLLLLFATCHVHAIHSYHTQCHLIFINQPLHIRCQSITNRSLIFIISTSIISPVSVPYAISSHRPLQANVHVKSLLISSHHPTLCHIIMSSHLIYYFDVLTLCVLRTRITSL